MTLIKHNRIQRMVTGSLDLLPWEATASYVKET